MKTKKVIDALTGFSASVLDSMRKSAEHDMPALFVGETGVGKTHLIREVAREKGKELIRINLTGQTTVDEILGKYLASPEKGTYWVDGLVTRAMRQGHWVVLDEVNMMLPEITARLHSLLDDDKMIVLTEKEGEIIRPHRDFRLFATMNPSGEYGGTKELNRAFMSRFPLVVEVSASAKEAQIIQTRTGASIQTVATVTKLLKEIRKAKGEQKISFYPSTRDAISACKLAVSGVALPQAVYMSIIAKAPKEEQEAIKKVAEIIEAGLAIAEEAVETDVFAKVEELTSANAVLIKERDQAIAEAKTATEGLAKLKGVISGI